MPLRNTGVDEFKKSGPVYMTLTSNEVRREELAGQRDWMLILGISILPREPSAAGDTPEQSPVIEVWDRNDRTFQSIADATELGMHFLGKTMAEVVDNYRFCWAVESDKFRKARITGFSIQPVIRDADGSAQWDEFIQIGHTQLRPFIRAGLAVRSS